MELDPKAFKKAEAAATAIRPKEYGGCTPMDQVPHVATLTAITTYLEEVGLGELDPTAFAKTYAGTGIFGWHFKAEIAAVICNYLADSGVLKENLRLHEHCGRLEERCRILGLQGANAAQAAAKAMAHVSR